ncbi:MAG: CpsB/CapC family capsule biosynthesis tyrosine phosphatase [Ruminococcus sp.]|jgi:protein-tyrosine phosphatase
MKREKLKLIDIHSHILPGVDDGARDEGETRAMLKIAYEEGIRIMFATSHYHSGMGKNTWEKRSAALEKTRKIAKEIAEDFRIAAGAEIFYSEDIIEELIKGNVWTLNGSRYVLVEFPVYEDYAYIRRGLQNLQYHGFCPILAHVERYDALKKEEWVEELVSMGICLQANAGSVLGKDGTKVRKYLLYLMENEWIHFIGTDAHGKDRRRPQMAKCASYIEKKIGRAYCLKICRENARKVIRREYING